MRARGSATWPSLGHVQQVGNSHTLHHAPQLRVGHVAYLTLYSILPDFELVLGSNQWTASNDHKSQENRVLQWIYR